MYSDLFVPNFMENVTDKFKLKSFGDEIGCMSCNFYSCFLLPYHGGKKEDPVNDIDFPWYNKQI